jgi:elongation factor G
MPDDYLGDVISDLNSRRAKITKISNNSEEAEGQDNKSSTSFLSNSPASLSVRTYVPYLSVEAFTPLSEMFGYIKSLRSVTKGRAAHSMEFSHYNEVSESILEEIRK